METGDTIRASSIKNHLIKAIRPLDGAPPFAPSFAPSFAKATEARPFGKLRTGEPSKAG